MLCLIIKLMVAKFATIQSILLMFFYSAICSLRASR